MGNQNPSESIVGGFIWKFGERLIAQGVSFVTSLVLARLLSPDDYGLIAIVLVFINLANVFITSGFATALIQKKDANSTDFSTIFYCSLVCSILIYLVIFLISPVVAVFYRMPQITPVLRVYGLQVPLSVYNSVQVAYVSRHMMFRKVFTSTMISALASAGIGVGMALLGYGVWALVAQSMSLTVVSTLVMAVIVPWHPTKKFSAGAAKTMMKYSSRVLLADLSGTFFGEVRSLIIGRVYTNADLAFYTKGQQLPNLITGNLSTSIMAVLFPAMANKSDNVEQVYNLARRSLRTLSYVLFPTLFGLAAVLRPLVIFLYTDKWVECVPYAQMLCMGYAIGVLGIVPLQTLKAIGRSDVVLGLEIWKKPVYVLLLVVGVNVSVSAVALTMVIYEIYGLIVNMLQMKKYIGYSIGQQLLDILPAFLLAGGMTILVLAVPAANSEILTILLKVLVGVVVYVIGSIVLNLEPYRYILSILKVRIRK